jgi:large subunit ribosomal protein L29
MKAKDLRERSTEDLTALKASMAKDLFSHKMKNFTGQLDDTSLINKARKDIARIELLLSERASKGAKS